MRHLTTMDNSYYNQNEYLKVDKISDDVYPIAPNIVLKFNVSLSKVNNGTRYPYHREYEYPSHGVQGQSTLVTIKRSFDYYLSIENNQKDEYGNKLFIRIGPSEYMIIKKSLENAISWFTDKEFANLYARNNGRLIMMPPIPDDIFIKYLPMGKYIKIRPTVIDRGLSNSDSEAGICMELSDPSMCVNINVDRLMGLYYIISTFDMYGSALSIINYLQRPEFGTNRFSIDQGQNNNRVLKQESEPRSPSGINGRFVTPKNTRDNIKDLE